MGGKSPRTLIAMPQIDERLFLVDRYGALRVPSTLWLTMAFLARHWIVLVLVVASVRRSPEAAHWLRELSWVALALEAPIFVLVLAAWRRRPEAGAAWRWLWARGRWFIVGTAGLHWAYVAWHLATTVVWRRWPELFLASCALLDLAIVYAMAKDAYYRQLFADYPAPQGKHSA